MEIEKKEDVTHIILGRSQDLCQGQKKVEECCGGPMLLKEPRGVSQVYDSTKYDIM